MKHKIVGILDITLATIFSLAQFSLLFFVYPRFFRLYSELDIDLPAVSKYYSLMSIFFFVFFLFVGFVGIKLLRKPTANLFKICLALLVLMIMLTCFSMANSVIGLINPIYNLTSSI